jgi:signal transduction histidine kinase/ActR/RegA family two-component response regulator
MNAFADNPLVRGIARIATSVQRKLLVAFAVIVVLLVTVGVLGLGVLSQSNSRADTLSQLPQRLAAYQQLKVDSVQLGGELQDRTELVVGCFLNANCATSRVSASLPELAEDDGEIESTLELMELETDVDGLGFKPPSNELSLLSNIKSEYGAIAGGMAILAYGDLNGTYVNNSDETAQNDVLTGHALTLVGETQALASELPAENEAAYLGSQHLFIAVAAASAVLAALLAVVLSSVLLGPIRKVNTRLAAIASGDFSGHVEVPNRDELGELTTNLNRMNDELGRLYQELEEASRHKSEFLAYMSHELRTPLNAVIGFSDVLHEQLAGDLNEKQTQYVTAIQTSGRHLLTLINDVLDLSKIEAGRMELKLSTFTLNDVLEGSIALMRERATRQGIALKLDVTPSVGIIEADERLLKQVLFNLLSNALNFTDRDGHVEVVARRHGDVIVISVRDDGVGITTADQTRIFEDFEQVGRSRMQEGTGLGLALSRRFVELHGGQLDVESELGRGSTFMFWLPRSHRSGGSHGASRPVERDVHERGGYHGVTLRGTPRASGQLVLIIEDNEKNRMLAGDLLRYYGFRTLEAVDAETGIEIALTTTPDIILMDIGLPHMDGVTALEHLRADPGTAGITVVALTASVMAIDRERFARAGFTGVILKPINVKTFPAQVLSFCRNAAAIPSTPQA